MTAIRRLLREPLLHFALLGAVLFVLKDFWPQPTTGIVVSTADQQRLQANWLRQTGRAPSAEEMTALINQHVDEELLLREAWRLGLHTRDNVVRERLIRNMRFAEPETTADDDSLFQAALKLGMAESDLVVRRRLIQRMRHRIESQAEVSLADARQFFEQQPERFTEAARYSFEHIYFAQPQDGDFMAVRNALKLGHAANELGEPFVLGQQFSHRTTAQIEQQLGADIAQLIASAQPGEWFGPVRSAFGSHLMRVESVQAASTPDYADISQRVAAELFQQTENKQLRLTLDALRDRYPPQIEDDAS